MKPIFSNLIQELHAYAKNKQYQGALIGLSGGLDSAIALCIAVRAFGAKNVTALILPEAGLTPKEDIAHAKLLVQHFGVNSYYQAINNYLVDFNFLSWEKTEDANVNLKAQVRAILLRYYADSHNALWISASNKSDLSLGLGTFEGELAGDLYLLGDLYKSDLIELAKHIGLPEELINKEASRHLAPKQTDLSDLGANWSNIDDILRQLNKNADPENLIEKGMDSLLVHKISRLILKQEAKSKITPLIPVGDIKEALKTAQEAEASST